MADDRPPEPVDLEPGDRILESHYWARDNLRIAFHNIQLMPEGQCKDELRNLHDDLANKLKETELTLATKERSSAQIPEQAKDSLTIVPEIKPLLPGYLAVAGSFFKSVARGALTASLPTQERVLQTLPNGLTSTLPRGFHVGPDLYTADDTSHDKYRDARHILQRLNKTDSPVSIAGREDVKRQFLSHNRDMVSPVDERTTKNHDEATKWACIQLQFQAHREKGRLAMERAQNAANRLHVLAETHVANIKEEEEEYLLCMERLVKEARQTLEGVVLPPHSIRIREKKEAHLIIFRKRQAELGEIVAQITALEDTVSKVRQELQILEDMEREAGDATRRGAAFKEAFEEEIAACTAIKEFQSALNESGEVTMSIRIESQVAALCDYLGDATTTNTKSHVLECNETCPFNACAFLEKALNSLSLPTHTSSAVTSNGAESTIPIRASVGPIRKQKQAHSVPSEDEQHLSVKLAAHEKDIEISEIKPPQEQGAVGNKHDDRPKGASGLAVTEGKKVVNRPDEKSTANGKENEEQLKLVGPLTNEWVAQDVKGVEKAKPAMEKRRDELEERKEKLQLMRQDRAKREGTRPQKDAFDATRAADDKRVGKAKPDINERRDKLEEKREKLRLMKQQRAEREAIDARQDTELNAFVVKLLNTEEQSASEHEVEAKAERAADDKLIKEVLKDWEERRRQSPKKNEGQRIKLQPNDWLAVDVDLIETAVENMEERRRQSPNKREGQPIELQPKGAKRTKITTQKDILEDKGAKNAQGRRSLHGNNKAEAKATKAAHIRDEIWTQIAARQASTSLKRESAERLELERVAEIAIQIEKQHATEEFKVQIAARQASASLEKERVAREREERLELERVAEFARQIEKQHAREEKRRRIQEKREARRIGIETKKAERRELAARKKAIQEKLAREIEEQRALKASEDAEAKARKAAAARDAILARAAELASSKVKHSPTNKVTGENDNGRPQHTNATREQALTPRTKRRRAEESKKREERQKNERLEKGARQFERRRQKEERKEAQRIALEREKLEVFQTAAQKKACEELATQQVLLAKEEARQEEDKKVAAMIKAVQALVAVRAAATVAEAPSGAWKDNTPKDGDTVSKLGSVEPFLAYVDTLHEETAYQAAGAMGEAYIVSERGCDRAERIANLWKAAFIADKTRREARYTKGSRKALTELIDQRQEPLAIDQGLEGAPHEQMVLEEDNNEITELQPQEVRKPFPGHVMEGTSLDEKNVTKENDNARMEKANDIRERAVVLRETRYALTIAKFSTKDRADEMKRMARLSDELEALKASYLVDFAKTKTAAPATISRTTKWDGVKKGVLQNWLKLTDVEKHQELSVGRGPHRLLARLEHMNDAELDRYAPVFRLPEEVPAAPVRSEIEIQEPGAELVAPEQSHKLVDAQQIQATQAALPVQETISAALPPSVFDTTTHDQETQAWASQEQWVPVVHKKVRTKRGMHTPFQEESNCALADVTIAVDAQAMETENEEEQRHVADVLRFLLELEDTERSRRSLAAHQTQPRASRIPVPSPRKIGIATLTSFHAFCILPKGVQMRVWRFAAYPEGRMSFGSALLDTVSFGNLKDPRSILYRLASSPTRIVNVDSGVYNITPSMRAILLQTCRSARMAALEAWKLDVVGIQYTFDDRGIPSRLLSDDAVLKTQRLSGAKLRVIWNLNGLIGAIRHKVKVERAALLAGGTTLPLGKMWADERRRRRKEEEALFAGRAPQPALPVGVVFAFMHGQRTLGNTERIQEWMRDVK